MGKGRFGIEATHPAIRNNTVVYSFDNGEGLNPGINVKRSTPINYEESKTIAANCPDGEWRAQYYPNTTHSGTPAIETCEATLNHYWGGSGPAGLGLVDGFGAKWSTNFTTTESKVYEFSNLSDNRNYVYLDGKLVISSDWYGSNTPQKTQVRIPAGVHNIYIVYVEEYGTAQMKFSYVPVG
jgi:hypothetical protein